MGLALAVCVYSRLAVSLSRAPTRAVFQYEPDQVLGDDDFVEPRNMRVDELAVMMNLAGQVGISFVGRLEDNLHRVSKKPEEVEIS